MENDGYKLLWGAVLERAIDDVSAIRPDKCTQDQRQALAWICSNSHAPRSFLWVCDMCGITASLVRGLITNNRRSET